MAGASDAAVFEHEADQHRLAARGRAGFDRLGADEAAGLALDEAAEARRERGRVVVELVAVQRQRGFEPQRVPAAEPGRDDSGRGPVVEQARPQLLAVAGLDVDLVAG
jgi:hypothetical protein